MKITIAQILEAKGMKVWSVSPETMVYDALQLMADKNIGAVLVMDEEKIVGIFSERDYARKIILKGKLLFQARQLFLGRNFCQATERAEKKKT